MDGFIYQNSSSVANPTERIDFGGFQKRGAGRWCLRGKFFSYTREKSSEDCLHCKVVY